MFARRWYFRVIAAPLLLCGCLASNPDWNEGQASSTTEAESESTATTGTSGGNEATTGSDATTAAATAGSDPTTTSASEASATGGCTVTRIPLSIAPASVAGELTNFPVLISGELPGDGHPADGKSLLFTDSDGVELPFELEPGEIGPEEGRVTAWVRVPFLSEDDGAALSLWLDHPAAAGPQSQEVWKGAEHLAVWHLELSGATVVDATGQQPGGTITGSVVPGVGQIGSGARFDGEDAVIDVVSTFAGSLGSFSVSAWIQLDAVPGPGEGYALVYRLNGTNLYPRVIIQPGGGVMLQGEFGDSPVNSHTADNVLGAESPHHVVVSYDSPTGSVRMFVDGAQVADVLRGPGDPLPGDQSLQIGRDADLSYFMDGVIDELRISSVARPFSWARTSYLNQSAPAEFVQFGEPVQIPCEDLP